MYRVIGRHTHIHYEILLYYHARCAVVNIEVSARDQIRIGTCNQDAVGDAVRKREKVDPLSGHQLLRHLLLHIFTQAQSVPIVGHVMFVVVHT